MSAQTTGNRKTDRNVCLLAACTMFLSDGRCSTLPLCHHRQ